MTDSSQEYILRWRGRQLGPFSLDQINRKLDDHELGLGHEINHLGKWISLEEFFEVSKAQAGSAPAPAQQPGARTPAGSANSPGNSSSVSPARSPIRIMPRAAAKPVTGAKTPPAKVQLGAALAQEGAQKPRRRLVYALLGILFGFAGLHNYYARHWLTGLLQLLLSVATYLLGFGIIAPWLWALAEAVLVRKDGRGLEMI